MKSKKAFQMSFSWIFAIIVGGFILFLAIFSANKFIDTGQQQVFTESAAELSALLDPFETGLASGKYSKIKFPREVRTFYECNDRGGFGEEKISFSERSGLGKEWPRPGGEISINNKYVFAESVVQGKELNVFSTPFNMPFKIADLIIISSENYCFKGNYPNRIEDDIKNAGVNNIEFDDCSGIDVCFGSNSDCDIKVRKGIGDLDYSYGTIEKDGKIVEFIDSLLYAAIVSSPEIYECNVNRLMKKFDHLAGIYIDKIKVVSVNGCNSNIESDLRVMQSDVRNDFDLSKLINIADAANKIDSKNRAANCKIY
jgi:hypothetical protein